MKTKPATNDNAGATVIPMRPSVMNDPQKRTVVEALAALIVADLTQPEQKRVG
jgi:hypothetical protein